MKIEGMHCAACVRRVTAALDRLPGVTVKHVEVGGAAIEYDPAKTVPEKALAAIQAAGFSAVVQ